MKDDVDGKGGQLLLRNIINFDSNEKYNSSYHYCDNITTNQSFFTNLHHENLYKDCDIEGTHLNGSAIPTFDF